MTNLDSIFKGKTLLCQKSLCSQSYGFSSGHAWMWESDYKKSWAPKNWCFWIVVGEKTLESPLDCKEIQPVHPKGTQSWIFTGRTVAEAEVLILWPPDAKSWLIGKDPDAGKDWRQEEKGRQRMRRADGILDSRGMNLSKVIFVFPVWQDLFISVSLMYISWEDGRSGTEVILDPWPSSKVTPLPNRTPVIWFPRWLIEISPSWSGKIMSTCLSCPTTVGPDKACRKLTRRICEEPKGWRRHQSTICVVTVSWKNFRGAERKNEKMICPANLPETLTLESSKMNGQRQPGKLTSLL